MPLFYLLICYWNILKAIVGLIDLHAFQVRVVQNKEPEHFLRMFRGRFIILEVRFYDHNHHPFPDKFFCPTSRAPEFLIPLLTRATQSKGGFPLSRYFYVLMRVKFTCVNKTEECIRGRALKVERVQLYVHEQPVHFPYFTYARKLRAYARKNNAAVGITLSAGTRLGLFFHSETIFSHVFSNNLEYKKQRATKEMY